MTENHSRPSIFVDEERGKRNCWKHKQKLLNSGGLKLERVELFKQLLVLGEQSKHKNQYQ